MRSGTKVVLAIVIAGISVALLREACVPVGSFDRGLDALRWDMKSDDVVGLLGPPNMICTHPEVSHLAFDDQLDPNQLERLREITVERWVYRSRRPARPVPRSADPACGPPVSATELGFDGNERLRWTVRQYGRSAVDLSPDTDR